VKKTLWSVLKWLLVTVGTVVVGGLIKGEQLKGLSNAGKLRVILTIGVPLWFALPLGLFAVYAGWGMYQAHRKPQPRTVGETNYYFRAGDDRPYCQICYDRTGKLVLLPPARELSNGVGRTCLVCTRQFIEQTKRREPAQSNFPHFTGSDSWMR